MRSVLLSDLSMVRKNLVNGVFITVCLVIFFAVIDGNVLPAIIIGPVSLGYVGLMVLFSFDEQNKWAGNVPSKDYYVYKLDPSFVFAKGDRKSIAVRNVEVYPPLKIGEKFTTTFTLNMNLHINNAELDDPPTGPHFEIKDFEIPVEGTLQEDYDLTIDEWQGDIGGYFIFHTDLL